MTDSEQKMCHRCMHVWYSHIERPVRCPACGTYQWDRPPVVYTCAQCGHRWNSRTDNVPTRCPACKTRTWSGGAAITTSGCVRRQSPAYEPGDVAERYLNGDGCVRISIDTGISVESVIRIIRSEVGDVRHVKMRAGPGPRPGFGGARAS